MIESIQVVTNSVQVVCCKCTTCFWASVGQIIIATFAVLSGCVAVFKYLYDKKNSSPKLSLVFEDNKTYSSIEEDAVDNTGIRNKQQIFKVALENNGACPAKDCKIKVARLTIVSGKKECNVAIDTTKDTHLGSAENKQRPISLNNGDHIMFDVFKICVNRVDGKGSEGVSAEGDKVSILVMGSNGVLHAFRSHQTHVRIELKLIAEMVSSMR